MVGCLSVSSFDREAEFEFLEPKTTSFTKNKTLHCDPICTIKHAYVYMNIQVNVSCLRLQLMIVICLLFSQLFGLQNARIVQRAQGDVFRCLFFVQQTDQNSNIFNLQWYKTEKSNKSSHSEKLEPNIFLAFLLDDWHKLSIIKTLAD